VPTAKELRAEVDTILATRWKRRDGKVVPESEGITLANDAVELDGTVLYADLQDSTALVDGFKDWFALKCIRRFLLRRVGYSANGGSITAFDGIVSWRCLSVTRRIVKLQRAPQHQLGRADGHQSSDQGRYPDTRMS